MVDFTDLWSGSFKWDLGVTLTSFQQISNNLKIFDSIQKLPNLESGRNMKSKVFGRHQKSGVEMMKRFQLKLYL